MSDPLRALSDKFRIRELMVYSFDYWTWSVRPVQNTLGASILSLNRPCTAWSQVGREAMADLHNAISLLEARLQQRFTFDRINYLMLMMVDPQVHFHVLPRYQSSRSFAGHEWTDPTWPRPPEVLGSPAADAVLLALSDTLRQP